MIIDLKKFIHEERPFWAELERVLDLLEKNPGHRLGFDQVRRFHYLYQRTSADLAKIMTFSSELKIRQYLESLVGKSYGEIHENRQKPLDLHPLKWFFSTFPRTFRQHIRAFWLAFMVMAAGGVFGGLAISFDPDAKAVLMPFSHLQISPSERVAKEESAKEDRMEGGKATFSSYLMTHNTKVSIFALALGMTWGIGTLILLFTNGVMLGAVVLDYVLAGETTFLAGWLLPHGSVEIPAILLASQAGLILAGILIGEEGERRSMKVRLKAISGDMVTLIAGVSLMLVWAGFIEAFFSQYHEPVIPYGVKIGFGMAELLLLAFFLWKSGAKNKGP
ncbi:MAG: hypothetical protein B6245_16750 [Desulfobacteraceae bacterium 4572_88]|nr:MAG: hypothetical protein B6245_16750 [Desulfobacteraceae bacterium 4572_88]